MRTLNRKSTKNFLPQGHLTDLRIPPPPGDSLEKVELLYSLSLEWGKICDLMRQHRGNGDLSPAEMKEFSRFKGAITRTLQLLEEDKTPWTRRAYTMLVFRDVAEKMPSCPKVAFKVLCSGLRIAEEINELTNS